MARTDEGARPAPQAPRKALRIESHDTGAYRGRTTVRERAASAALSGAPAGGGQVQETAREALEALVASERSRGQRSRGRVSTALRRSGARTAEWSAAKVDPLAKLKRDTRLAGEQYMDSLRRSGIVSGTTDDRSERAGRKEKQGKRLDGMHQTYAQMMALSAMGPLRGGVSGPAVVQTMGMAAAMFALSPSFRSMMGGMRPKLLTAVKDGIASRVTREGRDQRALDKLAKAEAKGRGKESLSGRWQRRLDTIERGNRPPFTVESAAMTEVALMESAYAAMRDPRVPASQREAHMAQVQDSYASAMEVLNDYIAADGLDRAEVSTGMRVVVGRRLEAEPELASVFAETGHGRFVKADPTEMIVSGTGRKQKVWSGDFVDAVTDKAVTGGSFSLRAPGSRGDHVVLCSRTLEAELEDATTLGELNDMFASYTAASVVRRYPGMAGEVEDPVVAQRMERAECMFASMRADGLSQSDQRYVYASSFVDAMEAVGEKNPELLAQWEAQYGPEWKASVQEAVAHYSDIGEQAERDRLIDGLVQRGFSAEEASAEVDSYRGEAAEGISTEGTDGPAAQGAPEAPLGFEAPSIPERLSRQDKALLMMDAMSDYVAADVLSESDRAGVYAPGAIVPVEGPGGDDDAWVGPEVFVGNAMGDYERATAAAKLGREEAGRGEVPSRGTAGYQARRRRQAIAGMHDAMSALGLPERTREAMMAAAYTRGLEKATVLEPRLNLVVDHQMLEKGRSGDWRESAYSAAMAGTDTRKAYERDRAAAEKRIAEATDDAAREPFAGKDPARGGYAAWQRQFDHLDEIDVPGQAKVGELAVAGPDTVRDQVVSEAEHTAGDRSGANRERKLRGRRATHTKALINQQYNQAETGGVLGVGSDDAPILQTEDPTLGD